MPFRRLIAAVQSRGRKHQRQRMQLAEAAARASYPEIWQRVASRTNDMTLAEARGYVRSVSVQQTNRELRQLMIGYPRISESEFGSILDRAVEHVARMILSQRSSRLAPEFWAGRQAA